MLVFVKGKVPNVFIFYWGIFFSLLVFKNTKFQSQILWFTN